MSWGDPPTDIPEYTGLDQSFVRLRSDAANVLALAAYVRTIGAILGILANRAALFHDGAGGREGERAKHESRE